MAGLGHRPGLPQVLTGLAAAAVLVHLFGLYRPAGPPAPSWFPHADKAEHVLGFAAPVALILLARAAGVRAAHAAASSAPGPARVSRRFVLGVVAVFSLHAVVSELVQHFFYTSRTGDPFDVLADAAGVALGGGVAYGIGRRARWGPGQADLPVSQ